MASNYPDGLPANEGGDHRADLPHRSSGASHPAHTDARAELRDRQTYYTELRFAVHCQSRSISAPRAALDDEGSDTSTYRASGQSAQGNCARQNEGTEGDWDDMIARLGDTWT